MLGLDKDGRDFFKCGFTETRIDCTCTPKDACLKPNSIVLAFDSCDNASHDLPCNLYDTNNCYLACPQKVIHCGDKIEGATVSNCCKIDQDEGGHHHSGVNDG